MKQGVTTVLRTDRGMVRKGNEDAVDEDASLGLLVLADGMGGHNAGEVASQIATRIVLDSVRNGALNASSGPLADTTGMRAESRLLRGAITAANTAIQAAAREHPQYRGMGTTVVTSWIREDRLTIAHVGDSRCYRLRGGKLMAMTRDHSMVEALVARGTHSREDALREFGRHVLTRAVGTEPEVRVDIVEEHVETGDILLLCSDGLTDSLDDFAIQHLLVDTGTDLFATADALIDAANASGGRDNITVALARIEGSLPPGRHNWRQRLRDWL